MVDPCEAVSVDQERGRAARSRYSAAAVERSGGAGVADWKDVRPVNHLLRFTYRHWQCLNEEKWNQLNGR